MTKLSPLVSEFNTLEDADAYEYWARAKVIAALADPRPAIPHDKVIAEIFRLLPAPPAR